jgi:CheY-like chemotaxis protein
MRALIAEDHPAYQTIIQTALEFAGYEVQLASNGREAVEALGKDVFHVLFMDLNMPVMHGLDALRFIKTMNLCTKIHIVVITANPHMAGEEVEQLSDYLMMKPINVEELAIFAERLKTVSRGILTLSPTAPTPLPFESGTPPSVPNPTQNPISGEDNPSSVSNLNSIISTNSNTNVNPSLDQGSSKQE